MATRKEYCAIIERMYDTHGVYVGGANGEKVNTMDLADYRRCENIYGGTESEINTNIARDLRFVAKCVENGYNMENSQACDCSGLEVSAGRECGLIGKNDDYRAREFQKMSESIPLAYLIEGDFVFNKESESTHMGTYIMGADGKGYVIESKGRDYGIVKRSVSAGSWKVGGRMHWFEEKIPKLDRTLYYIKGDRMKGEDVRQCKERLCAKGCLKSKYVDNVFGKHTEKAVKKFQKENNLTVDGVVNQLVWAVLWA